MQQNELTLKSKINEINNSNSNIILYKILVQPDINTV